LAMALVALVSLVAPGVSANDELKYQRIESKLKTKRLDTVKYEEVDITEVVKDIAKKAGVNILVDKKALKEIDEDDRVIELELADITADNALNIVIEQVGLVRSYKFGLLFLTTKEKAQERTILRSYDIRDITVKIKDFPSPKLRLKGEDAASGIIEFPDQEDDPPDADEIIEMIEESVEADWGGTASVREVKGHLVVRAPRDVQVEVAKLLAQLRASK